VSNEDVTVPEQPLITPANPVIEVKRALDGSPERRFDCELLEATPDRMVVLYRFDLAGQPIDSYGVFWRRRAYNCYYAVPSGGGAVVFVRFDVLRDVEFALGLVLPEMRYTDLLLDLWVEAGSPRWLDEGEVAAEFSAGVLTDEDARTIEATRALLDRRWRRVTSEVRTLLRGLGAPV
jgi:hypothetical protein